MSRDGQLDAKNLARRFDNQYILRAYLEHKNWIEKFFFFLFKKHFLCLDGACFKKQIYLTSPFFFNKRDLGAPLMWYFSPSSQTRDKWFFRNIFSSNQIRGEEILLIWVCLKSIPWMRNFSFIFLYQTCPKLRRLGSKKIFYYFFHLRIRPFLTS